MTCLYRNQDNLMKDCCLRSWKECAEVSDTDSSEERLGTTRSGVVRESIHRHTVSLASVEDADRWVNQPLTADELAVSRVADWGVEEDWSDWVDATR